MILDSIMLAADGKHMVCSGTVVDHVDEKTWILTSASLVRKPRTLFEAYELNLGMLRSALQQLFY